MHDYPNTIHPCRTKLGLHFPRECTRQYDDLSRDRTQLVHGRRRGNTLSVYFSGCFSYSFTFSIHFRPNISTSTSNLRSRLYVQRSSCHFDRKIDTGSLQIKWLISMLRHLPTTVPTNSVSRTMYHQISAYIHDSSSQLLLQFHCFCTKHALPKVSSTNVESSIGVQHTRTFKLPAEHWLW